MFKGGGLVRESSPYLGSFSSLGKGIADFRDKTAVQPAEEFLPEVQQNLDHSEMEEKLRWIDEKAYRAVWKAMDYEVPGNIWD
ncbi:predicted protein [Pyrenophora tritici-repentis Pt-1C-BFP]|uniref:Uncharacterized protein n=1 Tax=Pyrenophora tritici-repentis (strain Pt-1C-BFP) TaxID=426418 RepID=B2W7T5_PYRTR|nr:uncharacterized protein PTRG_05873 [Pyrenophora tritici-repentis Pt-1C-BFP]EDU48793.1 predicted protein [Pyrenophora tritici-repentis Pt-1C-BFP]